MPFSRIALHQGKSADYLQTLSDSCSRRWWRPLMCRRRINFR